MVINFESRRLKTEIDSVDIIYSNSWGETYSRSGFEALEQLRGSLLDAKPLPRTFLLAFEGSHKKRLFRDFYEQSTMEFKYKF